MLASAISFLLVIVIAYGETVLFIDPDNIGGESRDGSEESPFKTFPEALINIEENFCSEDSASEVKLVIKANINFIHEENLTLGSLKYRVFFESCSLLTLSIASAEELGQQATLLLLTQKFTIHVPRALYIENITISGWPLLWFSNLRESASADDQLQKNMCMEKLKEFPEGQCCSVDEMMNRSPWYCKYNGEKALKNLMESLKNSFIIAKGGKEQQTLKLYNVTFDMIFPEYGQENFWKGLLKFSVASISITLEKIRASKLTLQEGILRGLITAPSPEERVSLRDILIEDEDFLNYNNNILSLLEKVNSLNSAFKFDSGHTISLKGIVSLLRVLPGDKLLHSVIEANSSILLIEKVAVIAGTVERFPALSITNGLTTGRSIYIYAITLSYNFVSQQVAILKTDFIFKELCIYNFTAKIAESAAFTILIISHFYLLENSYIQGDELFKLDVPSLFGPYHLYYHNVTFIAVGGYEWMNCFQMKSSRIIADQRLIFKGMPLWYNIYTSLMLDMTFIRIGSFEFISNRIALINITLFDCGTISFVQGCLTLNKVSLQNYSFIRNYFLQAVALDWEYCIIIKNIEFVNIKFKKFLIDIWIIIGTPRGVKNSLTMFNISVCNCTLQEPNNIINLAGLRNLTFFNISISNVKYESLSLNSFRSVFSLKYNFNITIVKLQVADINENTVTGLITNSDNEITYISQVLMKNASFMSLGGLLLLESEINKVAIADVRGEGFLAKEGVLIYAKTAKYISIKNVSIKDGAPLFSGSLISLEQNCILNLENSDFSFNRHFKGTIRYGTFLSVQYNTLIFIKNVVLDGFYGLSTGGVFSLKKNNSLLVKDSLFTNCRSQLAGGVLSASYQNSIFFNSCSFKNISTLISDGGGFFLEIENNLNIQLCKVFNSSASTEGGLFSFRSKNKAVISFSSFDKVFGGLKGGLFSLYRENLMLVNDVRFLGDSFVTREANLVFLSQYNIVSFENCVFLDFKQNFKPPSLASFIYIEKRNIIRIMKLKLDRMLDCLEFLKASQFNVIVLSEVSIKNMDFKSYLFWFLAQTNTLFCLKCLFRNLNKHPVPTVFFTTPKTLAAYKVIVTDQILLFESQIYFKSSITIFDISQTILALEKCRISFINEHSLFNFKRALKAFQCRISFNLVTFAGARTGKVFAPISVRESNLALKSSLFLGNFNFNGVGGVVALIKSDFECLNNQFFSNRAIFGGAIGLITFSNTFSMKNNKFLFNHAVSSASKLIEDFVKLSDDELSFSQPPDESIRYSAGRGGCLYIRDFSSEERYISLILSGNEFINSKAPIGGVVFHHTNPGNSFLLDKISFLARNKINRVSSSYYGPFLATNTMLVDYFKYPPFEIMFTKKSVGAPQNLLLNNITFGKLYDSCLLYFYGSDHYGETTYESEVFHKLEKGQASYTLNNGNDDLFLLQTTNKTKSIYISSSGGLACIKAIRENVQGPETETINLKDFISIQVNSTHELSFNLSLSIKGRGCIKGEIANKKLECEECPLGFYSIIEYFDSYSTCERCHEALVFNCYGGNHFSPKPGYWRRNELVNQFLKCPNRQACLGDIYFNGDVLTSSYNQAVARGFCAQGYSGFLCLECEPGYGQSSKYRCGVCGSTTEITIMILKILFKAVLNLLMIYSGTMVSFFGSSKSRDDIIRNVSRKGMLATVVFYCQVLNLFQELPINIPIEVDLLFGTVTTPMAPEVSYIFNTECLIRSLGIDIPVQYTKIMLSFIFYMILFIFLFFGLLCKIYRAQLKSTRTSFYVFLRNQSGVLIAIILYNTWSSSVIDLSQVLIESLRCFNFSQSEAGLNRLLRDLSVDCDSDIFVNYTIFLIVPLLIIILGVLPSFMIFIQFKLNKNFFSSETEFKLKANFTSEIFSSKHFYYRLLIIFRRILFLFLNVFLLSFSSFTNEILPINICFIALICCLCLLYLNHSVQPYDKNHYDFMNQLENWTFLALISNIICAISFFLQKKQTFKNSLVIGIFALIVNASYFFYFSALFWRNSGLNKRVKNFILYARKKITKGIFFLN